MKKISLLMAVLGAGAMMSPVGARDLVLLQTNDTHSQIDPLGNGLGGVERRKVVIDSIRAEHPDAILVDAGDAVQGTLFFNIYKGEVEMKVMNALGYDYSVLGNHDFDNGVDDLVKMLSESDMQWLSTNYDFEGSPLEKYFRPYAIREIDGKKIAFIGINLEPKGMISEGNYDGVKYLDGLKAANATAWSLKHNEKADFVVAITHIGYEDVPGYSDVDIAKNSEDIDVILGGHSHTLIVPGSGMDIVDNAAGRPVVIASNGKSGGYISEVKVDLDSLGTAVPRYKQIRIDSRLDSRIDGSLEREVVAPYRSGVDEVMKRKVGRTAKALDPDEPALLNFISDFIAKRGREIAGRNVDLAIANKGSLRRPLPAGDITEGELITLQPFANHIQVIDVKGSDLAEAFDVMASRGGDGVSDGVEAVFDPATKKCVSVTINGKPLDPEKVYTVATIDYLANGGDYMEPLTRHTKVASSSSILYDDLLDYVKSLNNKKINPSDKPRMHTL